MLIYLFYMIISLLYEVCYFIFNLKSKKIPALMGTGIMIAIIIISTIAVMLNYS